MPNGVPVPDADGQPPVEGAEAVGLPTARGLAAGAFSVLTQPGPVARETVHVARQLARIAGGRSDISPAPGDRRFTDPAWDQNPGYRRLRDAYLAIAAAFPRLVDAYESGGADWRSVEEARFLFTALSSALAPTNTLLGNPAALKRAWDTGGRSVLRGVGNMLHDLRHNGGMPSQTDRTAFTVGVDLAASPGAVVHRSEVAEVIQYAPSTERVHRRPLVIIPPPIGRFYFLDLRPGRSFVEYAVSQGFQVFLVSWRNPTPKHAEWDLDRYALGACTALAVARDITGSPDVDTLGFCAGGILMTTVLNHLAAAGDTTVRKAAYGVTLLDFSRRAAIGAFSAPSMLDMAGRASGRRGVITARSMGAVFTWMRPDDLIFRYLVDQWLMGEDPPVFDILAWNADGTNLPATLHQQFLRIFRENSLVRPGSLSVLGTPVDLSRISVPTFVTGAMTDHLTPWEGCYRTTQLLAGPSTFVLSNAGHIQSLVNPPGNPRASYWAGAVPGADPEDWRAGSERHAGSWWEAWSGWMREEGDRDEPAPASLGSARYPVLEPAPGSYVVDRIPVPD